MSEGQIMFLSGAVLMVLSVILGIVFIVRRKRYTPPTADASYTAAGVQPASGVDPSTMYAGRQRSGQSELGEDEGETQLLPYSGLHDPATMDNETKI